MQWRVYCVCVCVCVKAGALGGGARGGEGQFAHTDRRVGKDPTLCAFCLTSRVQNTRVRNQPHDHTHTRTRTHTHTHTHTPTTMARDRTAAADGHAPGGGSGQIFRATRWPSSTTGSRRRSACWTRTTCLVRERREREGGRGEGRPRVCDGGMGVPRAHARAQGGRSITAAPPKSWLHRCSVCGDRRARRPRTRREWQRWAPLDRASVASFVLPARAGLRPRGLSPPSAAWCGSARPACAGHGRARAVEAAGGGRFFAVRPRSKRAPRTTRALTQRLRHQKNHHSPTTTLHTQAATRRRSPSS